MSQRVRSRAKTTYNTFFMTSHVPAIALAKEIAALAPGDLKPCVFCRIRASEANDTNISHGSEPIGHEGKSRRNPTLSAVECLSRSSIGSGSPWRMSYMHAQGAARVSPRHSPHQPAGLVGRGRGPYTEAFGLARCARVEAKISKLGEQGRRLYRRAYFKGAARIISAKHITA